MTHIITASPLSAGNIREYSDNFIVTHLYTGHVAPLAQPSVLMSVYHQPEMELDYDSYDQLNSDTFKVTFNSTAAVTQALDSIAERILSIESSEKEKDEDLQNDLTITVCAQYVNNRQIVRYLDDYFADHESSLSCLDLYRYMHVANIDRIADTLKKMLNTEFIYPDDPITFGYALYNVLGRIL